MTIMERNTNNPNLTNESSKETKASAAFALTEDIRVVPPIYKSNSASRKNSTTGSIGLGANGMPTSNLSLSSTSSASSSAALSKQDSPTSAKQFYYSNKAIHASSNHSSQTHSKHNSTSSPQTSRRQSGNSITIKIISETNDQIEDVISIMKESDLNTNDEEEEVEKVREKQKDRDDGEDTTSISTSNEYSPSNQKQKKLKERKKLIRSSAQQQHHLTYQESEDQVDETLNAQSVNEELEYPMKNMNSAFDALFAAAEAGNSSISAMIEAKMAAEAAAVSNADNELAFKKVNSIRRSRDGSSRSSSRHHGGSVKVFTRLTPNENNNSRTTLNENTNKNGYLGSPQQLTRSCSCKRPGSFKKMKSKNASPNRNLNNFHDKSSQNQSTPTTDSIPGSQTTRRGTQCSITIMEDINSSMQQNRTSSLPFEALIQQQQQQQQQPQVSLTPASGEEQSAEIYRVRQFNITNKGSVINRGDSFKRSFKRSTQSISSNHNNNNNSNANNSSNSKKDNSPTYLDTNTLALPDYQDGFISKSSNSSNYGINETSFTNYDGNSAINIKVENAEIVTPGSASKVIPPPIRVQPNESLRTYVVYILGASTVGKNALIKQFKTSEYRGTYDIAANHLNDEETDEGVSVMLDGIESTLQFISMDVDLIKPSSLFEITKDNDAFIIVYSISDKSSFHVALEILKSIRLSENKNQPVILVGNKSDLVRKRSISREDGRYLALKYGCKFVETSVAINDKVDDLLAGILKQIRLKEASLKEQVSNSTNEIQQFTIEINSNNASKKHSRNYSDAQLHDLVRKSNNSVGGNGSTPIWSIKSNTLTRRLFKSFRHKDNSESINDKVNNSSSRVSYNCASTKHNDQNGQSNNSFFHKIFNSIFKKKSNNSDIQSVENLFTLPIAVKNNKSSKNEK